MRLPRFFLRETLNKLSAAVAESFLPILRFGKLEIHKVFLRFPNLDLTKNLSPTILADFFRASVTTIRGGRMQDAVTLTGANIRYLLTMLALDQKNQGVRCVEIAASLGKSKPSVHNMMSTLAASGLVKKEAYGRAALTGEGRNMAQRYRRYFDAVCGLLKKDLPEPEALQAACYALIAELPSGTLEALCSRQKEMER